MKSWKKLTALLLAGVLAGSAFTGCGKQSNDSSKPESSAAEESSVKETEAAVEIPVAVVALAVSCIFVIVKDNRLMKKYYGKSADTKK